MSSEPIILHHYPQSPVAEKIRVAFGLKGLAWKSVQIPRLPPKPNLMPLTGGYRLTPVMQIGADIYCDTKCILLELERRFPDPALFLDMAVEDDLWSDDVLFKDVVTVALVEMSPTMPAEFLADRGPLYFGQGFSLEVLQANYKDSLETVRAQFAKFDACLQGHDFLQGQAPRLADVLAYYLVWFLRDRMAEGDQFFCQFKNLERWEQRIKKRGHGTSETMRDLEALEIAKKAVPQTLEKVASVDPLGLKVGDNITIEPINGGPQVAGTLHSLSALRLSILREDERVGQVCVHFPRTGYVVKRT